MSRLRCRTFAMSVVTEPVIIVPNCAACCARCAWCRATTPPPCRPARKPRSALVSAVLNRRPSHGGPRVRNPLAPAGSLLRTVRRAGHRGWSRHSCTLPLSFAGFGEALVSEPGLADPPWASHPQPKVIEVEIDDGCCVEGQQLAHDQPADDRNPERVAQF